MITISVGQFAVMAMLPMITFALGMFTMSHSSSVPQVAEKEEHPVKVRMVSRTKGLPVAARLAPVAHEDLEPTPVGV